MHPKVQTTGAKLPSNINELLHKLEIKWNKYMRLRGRRSSPSVALKRGSLHYWRHYPIAVSIIGTAETSAELLRRTCEVNIFVRRLKIIDADSNGC